MAAANASSSAAMTISALPVNCRSKFNHFFSSALENCRINNSITNLRLSQAPKPRLSQIFHLKRHLSVRCSSALSPAMKSTLDTVVKSHKVLLFMKGTKDFPQCGFSNTVVMILKSLNVPFETMNILENENLRQGLKEYSNWPTFPQLYIDGDFYGGCDITVEAYQSGELQEAIERAMCS